MTKKMSSLDWDRGIPGSRGSCLTCSVSGPTSTTKAREVEGHWVDVLYDHLFVQQWCWNWNNLKEMHTHSPDAIAGGWMQEPVALVRGSRHAGDLSGLPSVAVTLHQGWNSIGPF